MELKYKKIQLTASGMNVLIVPLWNLNISLTNSFMLSTCFNRTFMELKFDQSPRKGPYRPVLIVPLWN